jgi:hypothetical protein
MISKQDRVKPRTVEDLERKYNFERKFSQPPTQGENGLTPFIGSNGNWWIGNQDTGVSAGANEEAIKQYCAGLIQELARQIPTKISDLINDREFVSESTVNDLINEAFGGSGDITDETDTTDDSTVNAVGETVYYSIDTAYLGSQKQMTINGVTISAAATSTAKGVRYPLAFTSPTEIKQITIAANRSCVLTASAGRFVQNGFTWTWLPNDGETVTSVQISCDITGAKAEGLTMVTK